MNCSVQVQPQLLPTLSTLLIVRLVLLCFFFFFFFGWQPVEVEQWWRSNGGGERERCQTFLGLEISLECNK